ncbi:GroES-like protein [Schizopora paradoxa]|uniref:GroES-like protein n=1 Tax=Schizopora paradoxa TaxID=27342 RepID=A0A0H2RRH2_9AGAM|nr:GroES-like protein [Schizopora paradoxa]
MSTVLQKALFLDGPCGELFVGTKDIQKPEPGEVLVKIIAAALNPADWRTQKTNPPHIEKYPYILGNDSAGVVEELGEGVTGFVKGDRVIYAASWGERYAAFQQYTITPVEHMAKLPENISFEQAASIPLGLATAVVGLYADNNRSEGVKKLQPAPWEAGGEGVYQGKSAIVLGGSSSVGQFVIQLLKLSGFSKIITTASLHNNDLLKSLGATYIVDRNANLAAEAKKLLEDEPVDLIYDTVGVKETQTQALELLAPGGQYLAAALIIVDKAEYPDKHFVQFVGGFRLPPYQALGKSLFSRLHDLLASGAIKPNNVEVLPNGLAGIEAGLKRLENGEVSGKKLVVRPQETP